MGLLGAMALVQNGFDTYVYVREPLPNLLQLIGAKYISAERIRSNAATTKTLSLAL